ncbi:MAG: lytic transglycosylase domain-containing protein [Thermodesulfobacteriota bacterium]
MRMFIAALFPPYFPMRRFLLPLLCFFCLIAGPPVAQAALVELPLTLRTQLLQRALARHLQQKEGEAVVFYQEGPSRYLHADRIQFSIRGQQPHFTCHGRAGLGFSLLGITPVGLQWSGSIDLTLQPYVDDHWQLRYRILDSALFDDEGKRPTITGFVWDLIKKFLHPRLEQFSLDLAMPKEEISAVLAACTTPEEAEQLAVVLRTLTVGPVRVDPTGFVVPLFLTVDESRLAPPPLPAQAPLQPEEIEAFLRVLEPWDAFLVFVIKNAATDLVDAMMREELFDLLISSRYQLLPILSGETAADPDDPLRALFVAAWQELRAIIEHAEDRGLIQGQPLRYMTFINAGDALITLDKAAPGLGMRISSDGLRRWARTLKPGATEDPLRFDWTVDPQLRELFNFAPEPEPEATEQPNSRNFFDFFLSSAWAADSATPPRLDRWVPHLEELLDYQQLMEALIATVAEEEIRREKLDSRYAEVFRHLVPTTALIESCWRQYVRQGKEISYLKSKVGSIGLMQVNQNVWRGFYDVERLRWEVGYNTRAGAQILMRYLKKYGIAVEKKNQDLQTGIRATYAVYNAGPRAANRFMKTDGQQAKSALDRKFWNTYQAIASGGVVNLSSCKVDLPDA